jgi:hypothetical protein
MVMVFTLVLALGELLSAEPRLAVGHGHDAAAIAELGQAITERSRTSRPALATADQLRNPRTGVACTMLILKAEPVDPHAVVPAPQASIDPDIRGRVSPCLD